MIDMKNKNHKYIIHNFFKIDNIINNRVKKISLIIIALRKINLNIEKQKANNLEKLLKSYLQMLNSALYNTENLKLDDSRIILELLKLLESYGSDTALIFMFKMIIKCNLINLFSIETIKNIILNLTKNNRFNSIYKEFEKISHNFRYDFLIQLMNLLLEQKDIFNIWRIIRICDNIEEYNKYFYYKLIPELSKLIEQLCELSSNRSLRQIKYILLIFEQGRISLEIKEIENVKKLIKSLLSSKELTNLDTIRYCLWISDNYPFCNDNQLISIIKLWIETIDKINVKPTQKKDKFLTIKRKNINKLIDYIIEKYKQNKLSYPDLLEIKGLIKTIDQLSAYGLAKKMNQPIEYNEIIIGAIQECKITNIIPSRIFVEIENETRICSIFIGELSNYYIPNIYDFKYNGGKLYIGQNLIAKVISIDKQYGVNLSIKALNES